MPRTTFRRSAAISTLLVLPLSGLLQAQLSDEELDSLKGQIQRAVPTSNVTPISLPDHTILLTGTVSRAEDVDVIVKVAQGQGEMRVSSALRVGELQQVRVDAVVASVSRTVNRSLFERIQFLPTVGNADIVFGVTGEGGELLRFLDTMKEKGEARFLARPSLATLNGRPANFQVGGDQAVPVVKDRSKESNVEFEPYGTQLTCLPIVLGNGKIHLEVSCSVTTLDNSIGTAHAGKVVPGRRRSSTNTTVQMESGQTFIIGGLTQHSSVAVMRSWPVLGRLPLVGNFFSTKETIDKEEQLIILVTPHLIDGTTRK
jgi:pilus assembly protein CpaC